MACQCNACVGTGKCPTCSGTGEVEGGELRAFRTTSRDRRCSPGPQLFGVWRYRTLAVVKAPVKPMTGGETLAKDGPMPTTPECADEKTRPCSTGDWRACSKCGRLVCEKHDYLVPVRPPENACGPADMICKECVATLWYRGGISQRPQVQYIY
jgi:hypothetical protein